MSRTDAYNHMLLHADCNNTPSSVFEPLAIASASLCQIRGVTAAPLLVITFSIVFPKNAVQGLFQSPLMVCCTSPTKPSILTALTSYTW